MSSAANPGGARAPVVQLTCEHATSLVRGPTASARSANGTARMSTPRRARSVTSGPSRPGCSSGAVSTSSPGPELHPRQDAHDAVARARGQGDVGDVGPEHARRTRRAGGRAARSSCRRTPSRGPARRRGRAGRGSLARTRAAAARRCRRSGRPDPRGPGTRRAGRRHPPAAGYLPAADGPGRGAGAGVEHGRAAILLGLGRRRRIAAAADARPRPVVELVLAAEGAAAADGARVAARLARGDRSKDAGGIATFGAPPVLRSSRMSARSDRRSRRRRASDQSARGARTRGARGGGPGEPCAAPGAAPRARPGAGPAPRRSGCAARAGRGRGGAGRRRPGPRRQGRRSRRTRRTRPTASWASSSKSRPTGRRRRTRSVRTRQRPFGFKRAGAVPRRSPPRERRREAGATPRRGRVSGTLRSRAPDDGSSPARTFVRFGPETPVRTALA